MGRTSSLRSLVVNADPDWPRTSQVVAEYEFSGGGNRTANVGGYREQSHGQTIFTGRYQDRGIYAGEWDSVFSADFEDTPVTYTDQTVMWNLEEESLPIGTGPLVRLTFRAGNASAHVKEMWIGNEDSSADFGGDQVQVTYQGQSEFVILPGKSIVTDNIDFAPDGSGGSDLIIRAYFERASSLSASATAADGTTMRVYVASGNHASRQFSLDGSNSGSIFQTTETTLRFLTGVEVFD